MRLPQFHVTVDLCIWHLDTSSLLLIQRHKPPFQGDWALPGGHVETARNETLEEAARRELFEETGLVGLSLMQIGAYGNPGRDPRGSYVTILYASLIFSEDRPEVYAGDDAKAAVWWPLKELPSLAFDHQMLIQQAIPQLS